MEKANTTDFEQQLVEQLKQGDSAAYRILRVCWR